MRHLKVVGICRVQVRVDLMTRIVAAAKASIEVDPQRPQDHVVITVGNRERDYKLWIEGPYVEVCSIAGQLSQLSEKRALGTRAPDVPRVIIVFHPDETTFGGVPAEMLDGRPSNGLDDGCTVMKLRESAAGLGGLRYWLDG